MVLRSVTLVDKASSAANGNWGGRRTLTSRRLLSNKWWSETGTAAGILSSPCCTGLHTGPSSRTEQRHGIADRLPIVGVVPRQSKIKVLNKTVKIFDRVIGPKNARPVHGQCRWLNQSSQQHRRANGP
jgi:hypothetical protein